MSKIILVNGPCGIGKSTISRMIQESMELCFLREKDVQRRNFSHYKGNKNLYKRSGVTVLEMSYGVIGSCLENDIDLVFDGVITDKDFITSVNDLVISKGGDFFHIILTASHKTRKTRLVERGLGGSLTMEKAIEIYDKIEGLNSEAAIKIDTQGKSSSETTEEILDKISI